MPIDANSMPPVYLQTIREGLMGQHKSFAEIVCAPAAEIPDAMSGKVLYHPSYITLPKPDQNGGKMGLPPLTEGQPLEDEVAEADFNALAYEGYAEIPEERQVQGAAYGEDTLNHFIQRSLITANTKEDYDFAANIASTTLNQEYTVSTSWANGGGSPFRDLRAARRTLVPDADMLLLARDVADELALHDEMIGRVANFSGGGALSNAELAAAIQSQLTGVEVHVFDRYYNSAARGSSTITRTYMFAGGVWFGKKSGLLYVKPKLNVKSAIGNVENDALRLAEDIRRRADIVKWVKYSDPGVIPDSAFACTFTGAIA